ncbi:MAG: FKBP-type peptidyl-prolyl cis-trans isomerase [Bacteroidetes bacterium]|nr:FKBP-type peptidyl-prolyl cis-trans isomerase [Bacteroidota bacterium]MDA1333186.1 FKBP-type peptidyl-prolyl cis-trans isomerase [Bacteroidota bacterium]
MKALFSFLLVGILFTAGCASDDSSNVEAEASYVADLIITDTVEGDGPIVEAGNIAVVHYTLWLYNADAEGGRGERLQSSKDSGTPFPFNVGQGRVIQGWDQGVPGMKVGGTRVLVIPYRLAYGETARPGIPAKSDLIFEIDLLEIQ